MKETQMKTWMRGAAAAALIAAGLAPAASAQTIPAAADSAFRATILSLSAFGETRIAPDMATITLGVTTEAPDAAAAMSANAQKMSRVIAALKRGGFADKDIQTAQINLEPQYVYEQNQPPRLTGHRATNQVTVTVRDLTRLGPAIDTTVGAGANQVSGINFSLADPAAAEDAARKRAVAALKAKADLYAQATGYRVVRMVSLTEGGGYAPPPPMPMMAMARMEKADTPVSAGELRVRVDVSAVYELAR
jgi:uncharacterized protein YggE